MATNDTALEYSRKIFNAIVPEEGPQDVLVDVGAIVESLSVVCSFFISRCPPEARIDLLHIWQRDMLLFAARIMKGDFNPEHDRKH
jgi:hypothetical protein